ncbi:hypothetical protein RhiirB3_442641 [Rhizophagus irregularis]|nr:hypothetical protein RhiirB3_442641 [Rhizophagus irregularis]
MEFKEYRGKHCWIRDAINLLKNEDMCLCIHDTKDKRNEHRIKGSERDNVHLMKWKHFIMKKGLNLKGKIPGWFKKMGREVIEDQMTRKVKDKYLCGEKNLKEIHLKLFDEIKRNQEIKKFKRIGYHMVFNSEILDLDNSSELVKCRGCEKNNSLIEEERKGARREEIFLIVESLKLRNRMEENGKRSYEYILKILIRNEFSSDKEELKFSVRYDDKIENEFKVILRGIILGMLLNINGWGKRCRFRKKYMEKMNIKFIEGDFLLLSSLDKIRLKLREELINEKSVKDLKVFAMKYIDEAMSFNDFNLYWKKFLIPGRLRAWRKKCSELIWKNEMLK